jgi:hypothetical protein
LPPPGAATAPCQSLESNSPLLSNRSRKFLGKIPNGHMYRHGIYQSKTSNLETSLLPQHVISPCQSLESNSPLLSNRSRTFLGKIPNGHKHGIYQSKTSSLRDFTQPQRKIAPFRKSPANNRPRVLSWKNNLWNGQFIYNL